MPSGTLRWAGVMSAPGKVGGQPSDGQPERLRGKESLGHKGLQCAHVFPGNGGLQPQCMRESISAWWYGGIEQSCIGLSPQGGGCASPCTPEHVLAERKPHVCNAFSELRCVPLLAVLECGASRAVAGLPCCSMLAYRSLRDSGSRAARARTKRVSARLPPYGIDWIDLGSLVAIAWTAYSLQVGWLAAWLPGQLVGWLAGWLAAWLVGWLVGWTRDSSLGMMEYDLLNDIIRVLRHVHQSTF